MSPSVAVVVSLLLSVFNPANFARQLIGTHILFRHGERSPTMLYPSDPNDLSFWSNGLGSLTVRGKFQHIHLGQYFRERYSTLLNSTYVASEIFVRSSDYDRTLMSAYLTLFGLYPASNINISIDSLVSINTWPENLPWQPIPVHTVPNSMDTLLGVSDCAQYTALVKQMKKSERIQNINSQFRDLFEYLEKNTKQPVSDLFDAWAISDTVLIEKSYNIAPLWATPAVIHQLQYISDIAAYHLMFMSEINRLRGGPLLRDILENIEDLILNKSKRRKAKIYSGHETIIAAILSFLGINYPHQPPLASALFFDLYRLDNDSYGIQLEYLNMTNGRTAYPIQLPGCENTICSIATLKQLLEDRLPKDMNEECQIYLTNGLVSSYDLCSPFILFFTIFTILLHFK
ncbi:unnamed protein product [Rotaria socialis]|uniref:acid phosphatase n=5 Tax=Rotaria socialis TaxID=392032 RepID=A0A818CE07_9BILA|nr:unnamed protein product [Rotaria socialis]CAF3431010.1 unnamed protein product [Rotaria socialis]CAF4366509.1 unnamed protein product [Rotaria socialis]